MASIRTEKIAAASIIVLLGLVTAGGAVWWMMGEPSVVQTASSTVGGNSNTSTAPPSAPTEGPYAANEPAYQAIAVKDGAPAGFPYAAGWPLALPGEIIGTPVVADLLGDGKLEIVVPCVMRNPKLKHAHPSPNETPLLFAIRPDGTTLPGWPVELGQDQPAGSMWGGWASSPSVFRRNGKDEIVIACPRGGGVKIIPGSRLARRVGGADPCINVPLADLDGDGIIDIAIGGTLCNVNGDPLPNWPQNKKFRNGYAPCIGDAFGDGKLELFHLYYTTPKTNYADLAGVDSQGNRLPGWPRKIDDPSWLPPVMGDVTGDAKMEIIATYGEHLFAWGSDGKQVPKAKRVDPLNGILKEGISAASSCPALADLDGDGKAEIILFDSKTNTLRAWHGDGTPLHATAAAAGGQGWGGLIRDAVGDGSTTATLDGVIATLPNEAHGVSVVSLSDDPKIMDLFAGTFWVRLYPDGHTDVKNMIADNAGVEWTQPTICDIDGDGKADAIFGTSDGRLFIYNTGLAYHPDRMQWPTANGNFQHTGCWKKPAATTTAPATGPVEK